MITTKKKVGISDQQMISVSKTLGDAPSFSTQYLSTKSDIPQVSAILANNISEQRRLILSDEVEKGFYREGSSDHTYKQLNGMAQSPGVIGSFTKKGQAFGVGGGYGGGPGHGDTSIQAPEIYSPLWLTSNMNLPRDRATINAWCRSFFALNPFVHNAISLHSTYPISKLSIKCPNKDIEKFFDDMIEELDLMNVCVQIAQEYFLLGEAFVYAELDEGKGKWSRIHIQNPDFMIVKRTVVANEPIIMLRPDENLKKIVMSNRPTDVEQRKQLNQHIIESVRRGENIPLDNFHVSHLARKISPYEIRGTGLPVCIFRPLMLYDMFRECYSEDTEVLTDKGFKKVGELVHQTAGIQPNPTDVRGVMLDEAGQVASVLTTRDDFKIATFDPDTNSLVYEKPKEIRIMPYEGKMHHFKSRNNDILVTPNHTMWAKKHNRLKGKNGAYPWTKIPAKDVIGAMRYSFRGVADWKGETPESVSVLGKDVPIKLYLKFLGYLISEGCLSQNTINMCQKITSECVDDMRFTMREFAKIFDKKVAEYTTTTKDYKSLGFKKRPDDRWAGNIYSKALTRYFIDLVSTDGKATSLFKKIPDFVKQLDPGLLKVFITAMVNGGGSYRMGREWMSYQYWTSSKQLANDMQEITFKCGFAPSIQERAQLRFSGNREYMVSWSDSPDGRFPRLVSNKEVDYKGIVWCAETTTGLFVTRRNGQITIQGNCKFVQASDLVNPITLIKMGSADYKPTREALDEMRATFEAGFNNRDFKIFTHDGVDITRVGAGQGIYDTSGDITQLVKEIYVGLQVPPVMMDGGADTTYANGGVALDVLRQRYMAFRNMMSHWLKTKIFAPISKIQGFYDYSGGEKQLIVPEVDWNHMSLFDTSDYISLAQTLTIGGVDQKRISLQTLYRSMGLEYEDEVRKMRKENIQMAISKKEIAALEAMDLNALRSLDEEDEIPEPPTEEGKPGDQSLPGETAGGASPSPGGAPDLSMPPMPSGGGAGSPPPMPPPSSAPAPSAPPGNQPPTT